MIPFHQAKQTLMTLHFPAILLVGIAVWLDSRTSIAAANASQSAPPPRKKFIEVGWDIPDTAFLRQHWQEMDLME